MFFFLVLPVSMLAHYAFSRAYCGHFYLYIFRERRKKREFPYDWVKSKVDSRAGAFSGWHKSFCVKETVRLLETSVKKNVKEVFKILIQALYYKVKYIA